MTQRRFDGCPDSPAEGCSGGERTGGPPEMHLHGYGATAEDVAAIGGRVNRDGPERVD